MNQRRLDQTVVMIALLGGLIALFGTYWDDAWHTDLGRDEFASPPHLVLYGGVALVAVGVALWAGQTVRQKCRLRALLEEPALLLAGIGVTATFLSAPIDDFWHTAFGRDAVLWSPPHMVGVAALFTVSIGLLIKTRQTFGQNLIWFGVASALVLGTALVPVMEYETDVPQFAMIWYLPVQILGSALAFTLIRTVSNTKWAASVAAIFYTLLRVVIFLILFAMGHSLPIVPPIIVTALAFDILLQRQWSIYMQATMFALFTFMIYGVFLAFIYDGFEQSSGSLVVGAAMASAAACIALAVQRRSMKSASALVALLTFFVVFSPVQSVFAHDPGQGDDILSVQLTASGANRELEVVAVILSENCEAYVPIDIVARRAGETLRSPLQARASCVYGGAIAVNSLGRWFIYAEFRNGENIIEGWLSVTVNEEAITVQKHTALYSPPQRSEAPIQLLSGITLYAINFFLVGIAIRTVRKATFV